MSSEACRSQLSTAVALPGKGSPEFLGPHEMASMSLLNVKNRIIRSHLVPGPRPFPRLLAKSDSPSYTWLFGKQGSSTPGCARKHCPEPGWGQAHLPASQGQNSHIQCHALVNKAKQRIHDARESHFTHLPNTRTFHISGNLLSTVVNHHTQLCVAAPEKLVPGFGQESPSPFKSANLQTPNQDAEERAIPATGHTHGINLDHGLDDSLLK